MTLIDRMKAALEGATEGPWFTSDVSDNEGETAVIGHPFTPDPDDPLFHLQAYGDNQHVAEANAELAALSPDMAKALIAAEELERCCDAFLELMERTLRDHAYRLDANRTADFYQGVGETSAALAAYRKATEDGE